MSIFSHTKALALNTRLSSKRTFLRTITMATAHKIHIDAADTGLWKIKQTEEAARKTSELLQKDLEASKA